MAAFAPPPHMTVQFTLEVCIFKVKKLFDKNKNI